jgi:hypothetical protein
MVRLTANFRTEGWNGLRRRIIGRSPRAIGRADARRGQRRA